MLAESTKPPRGCLGLLCPEAAVVEDAKKKMQVMDMAVALHRKWQQRKELDKAQGLCRTIAPLPLQFSTKPFPHTSRILI